MTGQTTIQRVLGLVALVSATCVAFSAPPAHAATDPTAAPLTDELLIAVELIDRSVGKPGKSELTGPCNPTGNSTFQFAVKGDAFGPYTGKFTEAGTFTLGPAEPGFDPFAPLSFESTFRIRSGPTSVTGTKVMTTMLPFPLNSGACGDAVLFGGASPDAAAIQVHVAYSARISTHSGTYTDSGESFVEYTDTQLRGIPGFQAFGFLEFFTSTAFAGPFRESGEANKAEQS